MLYLESKNCFGQEEQKNKNGVQEGGLIQIPAFNAYIYIYICMCIYIHIHIYIDLWPRRPNPRLILAHVSRPHLFHDRTCLIKPQIVKQNVSKA